MPYLSINIPVLVSRNPVLEEAYTYRSFIDIGMVVQQS